MTDRVSKKGVLLKDLVINAEQAKIVKKIYEYYVENGLGVYRIAKALNAEKLKTLTGLEWTSSLVSRILANPIYKGYMVYGRNRPNGKGRSKTKPSEWILSENRNDDIAIISEMTWQVAQDIKSSRIQATNDKSDISSKIPNIYTGKGSLLLVGLVKCGCCGYTLQTGHRNDRGKNPDGTQYRKYIPYYRCVSVTATRQCELKRHFSQEAVEGVVLDEVYRYLDKMEKVDLAKEIDKLQKQNLSGDLKLQKELNSQLTQLNSELIALKSEVVNSITGKGKFSAELLNELISAKSADIITIENELAAIAKVIVKKQLQQSDLMQLKSTIPVWKEEFEKADLDTKKVLLAKIIDRITLYNDKIDIKLKLPIDSFLDEEDVAINSSCRRTNEADTGMAWTRWT